MPIEIANRRRSPTALATAYPDATIIDVTSRAPQPWVRFSPFYPHGGIPVPNSPGVTSQSVEGIWQALKVFEHADVDPGKLDITSMRNLKRTSRRFGRVLGHRDGLTGSTLLPYAAARRAIYLPSYRWVLEHKVTDLLRELADLSRQGTVVLLDYTVNADVDDLTRPLSHAGLIRLYLSGQWPDTSDQRPEPSEQQPASPAHAPV